MKGNKIVIQDSEAGINPTSEILATTIMSRMGLLPRKRGSTDKMHNVMIALYEASKKAYKEKRPENAVMTVEELSIHAGISRQTMYEYISRWLDLDLVTKTSYIKDNAVIIGYRLNGATLENAFEKAMVRIRNHMDLTMKYIGELQKTIKNEKISKAQRNGPDSRRESVGFEG
ncbi:hypothetical protein COV93_01555 [Candidatus Woesearchaeota archaeon CG11_big_fil_rev_8_21_14_0_20_43_8]|nr:MAG: hypothetical protein COV93_01555 [Candidatus Woesearchaeota archaeon CG11_big_fil_rev_8_21_14_0_20_43_8]PIO05463.1 MAG: hypothetical protein COT47_04715 [Candidatus Woesearchaeota archaeon CG08_land_8_20_14_0_20_43_7]